MGGITNKLTEIALRNVKPGATTKKIGRRRWIVSVSQVERLQILAHAYRYGGKQKLLALGVYPNV